MPPKAQFTREDGLYHSFCGLVSVGWLYQKIKDSFFLILGTHTCAHLLQNTLGVMIFARPRFAVSLLEDAAVIGGLYFAATNPGWFLLGLAVLIVLMGVALWFLAKFVAFLVRKISGLFARRAPVS